MNPKESQKILFEKNHILDFSKLLYDKLKEYENENPFKVFQNVVEYFRESYIKKINHAYTYLHLSGLDVFKNYLKFLEKEIDPKLKEIEKILKTAKDDISKVEIVTDLAIQFDGLNGFPLVYVDNRENKVKKLTHLISGALPLSWVDSNELRDFNSKAKRVKITIEYTDEDCNYSDLLLPIEEQSAKKVFENVDIELKTQEKRRRNKIKKSDEKPIIQNENSEGTPKKKRGRKKKSEQESQLF